jgi:nucleoside-diphosphate-sugar epimerase
MRLLVIGGTVFVGRAVVEEALRRGHEVTVFHRGLHGADLFGDAVTRIRGDRRQGLGELRGRSWDAVIDTCLFDPSHAGEVHAQTYVFVSTGGVYRDWPVKGGDESMPLHETGDGYSELKAAAERRLEELMPGRVVHARAGLIVGPHENIGRLPWWLGRMAWGGRVLAPGRADVPIQLIDVRDLAAFLVDAGERSLAGPYNLVAPPGFTSWGGLLEACRDTAGPEAELVWADPDWVLDRVPDNWETLPMWPGVGFPGLYGLESARAIEAGLQIRPLSETVADTWAWLRTEGWPTQRPDRPVHGLPPEIEAALLAG